MVERKDFKILDEVKKLPPDVKSNVVKLLLALQYKDEESVKEIFQEAKLEYKNIENVK